MDSKSKIYVLLAIVLIIVGIFSYYSIYKFDKAEVSIPVVKSPEIIFSNFNDNLVVDKIVNTYNISNEELIWENIRIVGNATKPSGLIEVGDIISECKGEISIIWIPENEIIHYDEI